jgi:hypothetical protein
MKRLIRIIFYYFMHLIHNSCHILPTFTKQCYSLLFIVSAYILLPRTPDFVIPQHIMSPIHALDVQHFMDFHKI